jgi:tetratricopeptide (TPR) repeat protein
MKRKSMKIKFLSLSMMLSALAAMVSLPASACMNEMGTNNRGQLVGIAHMKEGLYAELTTKMTLKDKIDIANAHIQSSKRKPSYETINDLAVSMIRFGRYESAIKYLSLIEKKSPGKYQTASNLGTAYELMGNNQEALRWIKLGIARNKDSHYGTEWLHVKILEAKLNKTAFSKGSILQLDFGNQLTPKKPSNLPLGNDGKPVSLFNLAEALRYQMLERTEFVGTPDPIVAGLLYDWANLELAAGTMEPAVATYTAAMKYGYRDTTELNQRLAKAKRIMSVGNMKSKIYSTTGLSAGSDACEICEPPIEPEEN